MGCGERSQRGDEQNQVIAVAGGLDFHGVAAPGQLQGCVAAVVCVGAGKDAFVVFALTADEGGGQERFGVQGAAILDADLNGEAFGQEDVCGDAASVPGVPALGEPGLYALVFGGAGRLRKCRTGYTAKGKEHEQNADDIRRRGREIFHRPEVYRNVHGRRKPWAIRTPNCRARTEPGEIR